MFATLQGENYTANLYSFLAIYPLYDKENSERFDSRFIVFLNSARQLEVPLIDPSMAINGDMYQGHRDYNY